MYKASNNNMCLGIEYHLRGQDKFKMNKTQTRGKQLCIHFVGYDYGMV